MFNRACDITTLCGRHGTPFAELPGQVPGHWRAGLRYGKGEQMTEEGMLSIVRRGTTYQVRYASPNPQAMDWQPYQCTDAGTLVALLSQ